MPDGRTVGRGRAAQTHHVSGAQIESVIAHDERRWSKLFCEAIELRERRHHFLPVSICLEPSKIEFISKRERQERRMVAVCNQSALQFVPEEVPVREKILCVNCRKLRHDQDACFIGRIEITLRRSHRVKANCVESETFC